MTRKKILIIVGVVLVGAAGRRRQPLVPPRHVAGVTVEADQGRATSKRSCRRRARSSRSGWSTSAPTRRAASSTSRSTKATASPRASSCCRSIRGRCARASTAAPRRSRPPRRRSSRCARRSRPRACSSSRRSRTSRASSDLWSAAAHDARGAREGRERRPGGRVGAARAREAGRRAGGAHRQERAGLESARYDLSKVRIESPIDGIVTRRNIQEGETAVIGTMNNAGTVLLTLADMSVIQAEVEVDETNIPNVALGQMAKITIDALPDQTFTGHVTEIGNSPIQPRPARRRGSRQATNFKVVVVIDERHPGRAARLHLHGRHHDGDAARASRPCRFRPWPSASWSYDANGQIVQAAATTAAAPARRLETVAVGRGAASPARRARKPKACSSSATGSVEFVPIKIGIAGESTSRCWRA